MRSSRMSAMLIAAALAGAAAPLAVGSQQSLVVTANQRRKPTIREMLSGGRMSVRVTSSPNGGKGGKHHSNRQHVRAAHKARNVRRHRAAARG